jgi:hypothetical protein
MNVSMGTNTRTQKKRVYYTESSTIYEGMPVCYEFDATTNVLGWDKGNSAVGSTTAEGNQNEGKFLRVEDPDADNIHAFAGVVAAGSHVGQAGPRWLDIFVPNGATVPCRTDLDCTVGRTVLSVESASQELTVPLAANTARPVAIAGETVDRSSTSGLVLAALCPDAFLFQTGDGSSLIMDDDATAAETVNTMNLIFNGTGGPKRGLYAVGEIAGAAHANYGMWKFRTYINAAASATVHTVCANLHIKDSGTLVDSGEWASAPLYVTVETEVTTTAPTLSGGSLAAIYIGYYVDESTAAPANAYVFHINNHASYNWDGLIRMGSGDLGDSASGADEAAHVVGFDGDGTTRKIPVYIDSTTYYLLVGTAIQGVADA